MRASVCWLSGFRVRVRVRVRVRAGFRASAVRADLLLGLNTGLHHGRVDVLLALALLEGRPLRERVDGLTQVHESVLKVSLLLDVILVLLLA